MPEFSMNLLYKPQKQFSEQLKIKETDNFS